MPVDEFTAGMRLLSGVPTIWNHTIQSVAMLLHPVPFDLHVGDASFHHVPKGRSDGQCGKTGRALFNRR